MSGGRHSFRVKPNDRRNEEHLLFMHDNELSSMFQDLIDSIKKNSEPLRSKAKT